ncbi:phage minor structural protein [Neobacillus niacini]|uniref:phage tail protein n=1 Tax=Neobacillus niacini TaxID=86668 RepID=UPI0027866829|nr:phage tail protein [Neobacillus niacini]MDQ1003957.1 phage minor structural protein [Neobacillus niacini]
MIINTLSGQSEYLTDYTIRERKRVVNGVYSLPFSVVQTERNEHSFPLVQEDSIVEYDGQKYRIKKFREYMKGSTPVKEIQQCSHVFFDIIEDYQYSTLSGTLNITQVLNHVFSVTDWTWVNQGAFNSVEFDSFGDGTALELFGTILERYGAEFEITGENQITLKNQVGAQRDAQFRYKHNIKTLYKDIDSSNISTFIKGFGKDITTEYTSPNSSVYGIRHAPPVRDERFIDVDSLQEHLQKVLIDTPNIVIEIDVVELKNQGIPIHEYGLGDTIFLIHEDLGIDSTVRILEYTDYPESFKSPTVVLANFKNSMTKVMTSFQQTSKTVKQLTDADGNLSLALKRLYRNSNHYSDHTGDWYISEDDPNAYVHIGAGGLDVHKGLVRVEREDGYAVIIGGVVQHSFAIQGSTPSFKTQGIEEIGQFYKSSTTSTTENAQRFVFKHDSRYLRIITNMYVTAPAGGYSRFEVYKEGLENDPNGFVSSTYAYETQSHDDQGFRKELLIDLGVPTGDLLVMYWRLYTATTGMSVYGSIRYIVQEG